MLWADTLLVVWPEYLYAWFLCISVVVGSTRRLEEVCILESKMVDSLPHSAVWSTPNKCLAANLDALVRNMNGGG
ncbi:MAG: hypothetical protein COB69_02245 [Phycisphaera sp.]|nr:MAG: hypothetical protein COB69_02245 [Phycisphaera sp.]